MSVAAERLAFAAIGRDLLAAQGSKGERRVVALTHRVGVAPATSFAALDQAPAWLRWSHDRQTALAKLVALRSMAEALAASIDGAWLGALADVAGERALDWAIGKGQESAAAATVVENAEGLAPEELAPHGFAILAAQLPPALQGYLAQPSRSAPFSPDRANAQFMAEALAFLDANPT